MNYGILNRPMIVVLVAFYGLMTAPVVSLAAEGDALIDKATDLKLEAKNFDDLEQVAKLCEEALAKGVSDDNKEFAIQLLAGTLLERANQMARAILGEDAIIGMTSHNSQHLAMEAGEAGADYVAFGAFFHSNTKNRKFTADPKLLSNWQESMLVPCVAIGGITVENCQPIVKAGADFIAVSAGVWNHQESPAAAIKQFNDIFDNLVKAGNI